MSGETSLAPQDAMSDASRQMLSMYYGMAGIDDAPTSSSGVDSPPMTPIVAAPRPRQEILDPAHLDSSNFNADLYLKTMLSDYGIRELIEHDNDMIAAKKTLDSDMQRLVYENYNKFISATDMIRTMKNNVENMEEEMKNLLSNINLITSYSHTVEENLSANRSKVDNLVGVSRLLKRLEFLFELPGRLKKSIAFGAHAQAVKYFRVSNRILKQYSHIKSFDKIRIESEEIILALKDTLRKLVRDPKQTPQALMENAAMLIDLSEPPDQLLSDVFASRRNRLKADLQSAVEQYQKQLLNPPKEEEEGDGEEDLDEEETKEERTRPKSKSKSKSKPKSAAEELLGDDDEKGDEKESKEGKEGDGADVSEGEDGVDGERRGGKRVPNRKKSKGKVKTKDLLQFLQSHFIDSFELFAQSFLDTFVRPYESKHKRLDKEKATTLEKCHDALTEFTRELFTEYFQIARKHLLTRAELVLAAPPPATSITGTSALTNIVSTASNVSTSTAASQPSSGSADAAHDKPNPEADKEAIVELTRILRHFWLGLNKPAALVPKARLGDRATEIIEHTVRHCVESVFAKTQANIVRILKRLHGYVSVYDSRPEPPEVDDDGDEKHGEAKTAKVKFKGKPPNTVKVSTSIREAIEQSMKLLVPVLSTSEYLPAAVGLVFGDLAHGHLHTLLASLNSIVLCRILRESEGPVWDGEAATHPLADLNTLTSSYAHPLFYLCLSQICQRMESTEIPAALKFLKQTFPNADERQMLETEVPMLLERMKDSGHALVQRYVEVNGYLLTRLVRKLLRAQRHLAGTAFPSVSSSSSQPSTPTAASSASVSSTPSGSASPSDSSPLSPTKKEVVGVSLLVTAILREVDLISNELNEIFPTTSNRDHFQSQVSSKEQSATANSFRSATGVGSQGGGRGNKRGKGTDMNRDIERLFTQKVVVFAPIKYSRASALVASLKIAFKTMVETIRLWSFVPDIAYQQIQADVFVLRGEVSKLVAPDEAKTIVLLLDEALSTASDRCAVLPTQLKPSELEDIYSKFKAARAPPTAPVSTTAPASSSPPTPSSGGAGAAVATTSSSPAAQRGVDVSRPPVRPAANAAAAGGVTARPSGPTAGATAGTGAGAARRPTAGGSPPPHVSANIDARAQLFGGTRNAGSTGSPAPAGKAAPGRPATAGGAGGPPESLR